VSELKKAKDEVTSQLVLQQQQQQQRFAATPQDPYQATVGNSIVPPSYITPNNMQRSSLMLNSCCESTSDGGSGELFKRKLMNCVYERDIERM